MWGEELTVSEWSVTNEYVPFYGWYGDNDQQDQVIIPSADLTEMVNGSITNIKFYTSSTTSITWSTAPRVTIRLTEVSESSLNSLHPSGASGTIVYEDKSISFIKGETYYYWNIDLDNAYTYSGGNLLIDIRTTYKTSSTYAHTYFTGKNVSTNMAYTYGSARAFYPQTTFTYTPGLPPTCPKPTVNIVGDPTATSASFSWTKGGDETQWQYLCLPASTTLTEEHWNDAVLTSETSVTLNGLSGSYSYKFYLRAYCAVDDQSDVVNVPFNTDCGTVTVLPWSTDFTGTNNSAPKCLTVIRTSDQNYNAYIYSNSLRFEGNNSSSYKSRRVVVILPQFSTDIKNLKISFKYQNKGTATNYAQFFVGCTSSLTDVTKFKTLHTLTRYSSSMTSTDELSLSGADEGSYIAIMYNNPDGGTATGYSYIDDLVVASAQDCSAPQNVVLSGSSISTADFTWDANTGVDSYKYCVVAQGEEADWSGDLSVNTNSVHVESLTPGNYTFYVKCGCGTAAASLDFEIVSCPTVTSVTLSNQVWDGVTVNWTTSATTNCDVRYSINGGSSWTVAEENISATSKVLLVSIGNTYTIQVKPNCSADGWVAASETYTPSCPTPSALTLSEETYNSVKVSWDAIDGVNTWNLAYTSAADLGWTNVNGITDLFYTIPGMTTNSEYTIRLSTECGGEPYSETTYTPVYAAPTSVLVSAQDLGGDASWAPVEGATGYQYIVVLKDAAQDWSTPATGTTVSSGYVHADPVLSGLHAKTAYDFYVKAVFAGGTSAATKKSFTTSSHAPNTPTVADGDITSSSAVATWTLPAACQATQCQWICKLTSAGAPAVDDAAWSAPTTEFTANISGLDAYTDYTVYVRAYYENGIYSSNATKAFKTKCGTETLPFSYDFGNNGTLSPCWKNNDYSGSYYWTLSDNYTWSSTEGYNYYAGFQSRGSSGVAYGVLETPSIDLSDEAILTFRWRNTGVGNVKLLISTNSGSTKTSIDEELDADLSTTTNWTNKSVDLSAYKGETIILYFKGFGNGSSKYIYIDDVAIDFKPCDAPTFTDANVETTATGATISCAADKWNLKYKKTADADIPENWTVITNITEATKAIAGDPDTEYEVKVQAVCSATRSSDWTDSQTFTPVNCPTPTTLEATAITHNSATISWSGDAKAIRYKKGTDSWTNETISPAAETFDLSGLTPESTYTVQVKADCEEGDNWSAELEFATKCAPITVTKVAPYEADFTGLTDEMPGCWEKSETTYPYVTSEELKFYANEANQTAILPAFSNDIATLVLKFKYKNYSSLSGYGKLQVGYIDNAGDFQAVGSTLANKATYFETEINFEGVTGAKNMAIRFLDNSNAEAYSYVKDVVVELAPTCYAPASIADATSITAEGATISWTASGHGETLYQWTVVEGSATPAWVDDDAHKVDATSKTLTGLNPQTNYTFYVRSYCGASDQSEVISKSFTTKCAAIPVADMPFEETFDGALGTCWRTYAATYYSVYVSNNELRATAPKTSGSESVVVLPGLAMALNQLVVSFDYKGSNGTIEVGYVTDAEDKTTFVAVGSAYTVASAYKQAGTALTSVGDATGNVALRFKGNTGDGEFTVDNLRVAYGVGLVDSENNTSTLSTLTGETLDVVVERTIYCDGDFNTLCLPFSLPTLAGTPLAGGELWSFRYGEVVGGELQIRIAPATSIEAGVPYLITFANGADIVNPTFTDVTITKSVGDSVGQTDDVQFIGILKPQAFVEEDKNNLFVASNGMLAWSNVGTGTALSNLRSFRGYFHTETAVSGTPVANNMPARIVKEEQTATGCENIQDNTVTIKIIENNQVVIIRNGVKYTVQGQVISK